MITVSIVSHGHGDMVSRLTEQLLRLPEISHVILTLNISETLNLPDDTRVQVIENKTPKGFGANHNAAFKRCDTDFYCVVNPDIELTENPFPVLLAALVQHPAALVAPRVVSPEGTPEDSWRHFPSPLDLLLKAFSRYDGTYPDAEVTERFAPDWIAGMFLLFQSKEFAAVNGFDERFFLYYEDVDLCARLRRAQRGLIGCSSVQVVHKAQRASWSSWRYRHYHLTSIARYFSRDWRRLFPTLLRGLDP
jgi:N-acetylglucosaminyl-diphospho-decaprenol L-rhamnosyltransferase